MLIISKFRDYYDSIAQSGVDKSIVYRRDEKEVQVKDTSFNIHLEKEAYFRSFSLHTYSYSWRERRQYTSFLIGFCGKWYLVIKYETSQSSILTSTAFYHGEEAVEFLIRENQYRGYNSRYRNSHNKKTESDIRNWYNTIQEANTNLFHELHAPIIVYHSFYSYSVNGPCLVVNEQLSKFDFFKQKDPYTSFQELQSFVSGVLVSREKDELILSDRDKIISHGMDTKWSFRNPSPPKRKQK